MTIYGCKSRQEAARPERTPTATPSAIIIIIIIIIVIIIARGDCARRARRSADAARCFRPAARLSTAPRDEGAASGARREMGPLPMIDADELILELDKRARKLAALDDVRLERAFETIRARAVAAFVAAGSDELSAFFAAEEIVQRLHGLIANRRRRVTPGGGAKNQADGGAPPARG